MTPALYLDRAITALRSLGINFPQRETPVLAVLDQITQYDATRVATIAATLQQATVFNATVRDELNGMDISTRFADIAAGFDSIRDDAQKMVEWMADGKLDLSERVALAWMKAHRGSLPDRFNDIRETYLQVVGAGQDQVRRETAVLEAYKDFRMALQVSEVEAQEVLKIADAAMGAKKAALQAASEAIEAYSGTDGSARARLELARDEALRSLQNEDARYQVAKDIADGLKTSYNSAELVFARLQQTHAVKVRLVQSAVSFFATSEVVFTGLSASFTANQGLSEASNAMEAMKAGMNAGLESLAKTGGQQLEAGLKAGYGPTLQASSVQALANAVVDFQAKSMQIIAELRDQSSKTAAEIEAVTEDAKRRFAALHAPKA